MPKHDVFMQRCLELAAQGAGAVSPNPMVGSVIVVNGRIIGEGYHSKYGGAHAEANAIEDILARVNDAEQLLKNSTLYVNLEPCAHFGKRPPCSDLIIRYRIPTVVIGCRDPFEMVNGKGIEKLKDAGVDVIENVLRIESLHLNRRFFTRIKKQRPYIILKWAQTSDGFFAPENRSEQRWISSDLSRKLVHKWRTQEDAVLVGKNTAMIDDPQLNVREWQGRNPIRIVIDRYLQLPKSLNLFDQSQTTLVFNSLKTDVDQEIKFLELEDFDNLLPELICYQLYLMDIQSLIIEGGKQTLELFIKTGLWDEARIFTSNQNWGKGLTAPELTGKLASSEAVDSDNLQIIFKP